MCSPSQAAPSAPSCGTRSQSRCTGTARTGLRMFFGGDTGPRWSRSTPGCSSDYLEYALEWKGVWDDRELALAILGHLLTPRLKSERTYITSGLTVSTRGDLTGSQCLGRVVRAGVDALVLEVFPIVEQARPITSSWRSGRQAGCSGWSSATAPAIQPHVNDHHHHRETIDAVVDAARDCIERLWSVNAAFAQQVARPGWAASEHTMLNRLALHGVGISPTLDADARARFVLESGLATNRESSQETFHLLAGEHLIRPRWMPSTTSSLPSPPLAKTSQTNTAPHRL